MPNYGSHLEIVGIDLPQPLIFAAWLREFRRSVQARQGITTPFGPLAKFVRFAREATPIVTTENTQIGRAHV